MFKPHPKNSPEKLFYIERVKPGYLPVAAIPEEYLQLILPYAGVYFDRDEDCDILSQHIQIGPFSFWIQEAYANANMILCPFTPINIWALHFMFETSVRVKLNDGISFSLEEKECNLFNVTSHLHKVPMVDGQKLTSCHINILPEDLKELARQYPALSRLADKTPPDSTRPINDHPYFINAVCEFLIQEMITCRHIEEPAHRFLYRCCLDLFTNFANQDEHSADHYVIDDALNVTTFHQLFGHLVNNPHQNHTTEQLSQMYGMETEVLESGFLKEFGMPVHAFINMTKMLMVFELLTEKSATLTEVAFAAGYDNWQTLNEAFTAYYGCDMEHLRRAM